MEGLTPEKLHEGRGALEADVLGDARGSSDDNGRARRARGEARAARPRTRLRRLVLRASAASVPFERPELGSGSPLEVRVGRGPRRARPLVGVKTRAILRRSREGSALGPPIRGLVHGWVDAPNRTCAPSYRPAAHARIEDWRSTGIRFLHSSSGWSLGTRRPPERSATSTRTLTEWLRVSPCFASRQGLDTEAGLLRSRDDVACH